MCGRQDWAYHGGRACHAPPPSSLRLCPCCRSFLRPLGPQPCPGPCCCSCPSVPAPCPCSCCALPWPQHRSLLPHPCHRDCRPVSRHHPFHHPARHARPVGRPNSSGLRPCLPPSSCPGAPCSPFLSPPACPSLHPPRPHYRLDAPCPPHPSYPHPCSLGSVRDLRPRPHAASQALQPPCQAVQSPWRAPAPAPARSPVLAAAAQPLCCRRHCYCCRCRCCRWSENASSCALSSLPSLPSSPGGSANNNTMASLCDTAQAGGQLRQPQIFAHLPAINLP